MNLLCCSFVTLMLLLTKLGGALIRNGTYNGLATDLQRYLFECMREIGKMSLFYSHQA